MRIQATEASRGFSDLLSRAAAGETIEIWRHGEVVAVIGPPSPRLLSGQEVIDVLERAPTADPDFADDVRSLGEALHDPAEPWPS